MKKRSRALARAIKIIGAQSPHSGIRVIAKVCDLTTQCVSQWDRPTPKHVLAIEALTEGKVTRYELRPDIYGPKP